MQCRHRPEDKTIWGYPDYSDLGVALMLVISMLIEFQCCLPPGYVYQSLVETGR